jgi:transcriptional regulator with XRE-family HTH domain
MSGHIMAPNDREEHRKRFGEWLRKHRVLLGLNQAKAGHRAGMSRTQWTRLEHGESGTRRENIPGIAKAVKTDVLETYRRAGYAPPTDDRSIPEFIDRFNDLPASVQDDLAIQVQALWKKYRDQAKAGDET